MAWRQQAIIWTNADPIHCRIYGVLRADELNIQTRYRIYPEDNFMKQYFQYMGYGWSVHIY